MKTDIWRAIADIGIELHPDRVNAIANRIASLSSVNEFAKESLGFGPAPNMSMINTLEKEWKKDPNVSPLEVAAALRVASRTASKLEKREVVEMVWTGPFTGLVPIRHTEQVLLEVIGSAKQRLFIVSFVAYNIDSVKKALHDAVSRNVKIDILLESSKAHGGKIDVDSIDDFKRAIPSASVYAWNCESGCSDSWNGAVHAKCAVADGSLAFITSANLTKAAMEKNIELGILVRGGNVPAKLEYQLNTLIMTKTIKISD